MCTGSRLKNNRYDHESIWRCNARYDVKGQRSCQTPHITEDEIKCRFLEAFNELMQNKKNIIEDCKTAQKLLCNTTELDKQIAELESELHLVEEIAMQAINENKRKAVDQTKWTERNEKYLKRYDEITNLLEQLDREKAERAGKAKIIARFIKSISKQVAVSEFDDDLWFAVIENVVVGIDGSLTFKFKNGIEIKN